MAQREHAVAWLLRSSLLASADGSNRATKWQHANQLQLGRRSHAHGPRLSSIHATLRRTGWWWHGLDGSELAG